MHPGEMVAQLAGSQDCVVSRQQLLALGATDEWIQARLRSGRWQRVFAGTYATFTGPLPFTAEVSAALLRAGPGSMARARTAAALYGLVTPDTGRPIELLLPPHRRVRVEPIIRVRYSQDADRRRNPLRSPAREWVEDAVLDLAEQSASLNDVAGWVSRANGKMLTDPRRRLDALTGCRRRCVSGRRRDPRCDSWTSSTSSSARGSSSTGGSGMSTRGRSATGGGTTTGSAPVRPRSATARVRCSGPRAPSPEKWGRCCSPAGGPGRLDAAGRAARSGRDPDRPEEPEALSVS
jgi:hypothetical protein